MFPSLSFIFQLVIRSAPFGGLPFAFFLIVSSLTTSLISFIFFQSFFYFMILQSYSLNPFINQFYYYCYNLYPYGILDPSFKKVLLPSFILIVFFRSCLFSIVPDLTPLLKFNVVIFSTSSP